MADNQQDQQNPQNQQGDAQERAGTPPPAQAAQDQGQDRAGAQEPPERDPVDLTDDVQALRHEAASRRRALRAVEAERDQLKGRIDARDRAEVEAIASNFLADASDFTGAVELDSLRGDDGAVVLDAVQASIGELLKAKPHYRLDRPAPNLHQGARQEVAEPPSFGAALKSGGRR